MQQEPWTHVLVHAASKIDNLLFFSLYFRPFFLKKQNKCYLLNTLHEQEWRFWQIFHDFIYVSLFQSKIQNLLSESDEYSSYKLRNYSCTVKYIKKISHQI